MTTVGMIGLGNYGSAVANLIAKNGYLVLAWEHDTAVVEQVNTERKNDLYLPGVAFHEGITATDDLDRIFKEAEVVFIAIPSAYVAGTLHRVVNRIPKTTFIVNMAKGIHRETRFTAYQTVRDLLPNNPMAMLSGPAIATEFAQGAPTMVVVAGEDATRLLGITRYLDSDTFRVRLSSDVVGVEWGGILKNIYAIGLGVLDGSGYDSRNLRAVYLTLAAEEIVRLGVGFGGQAATLRSLAGMGDLMATALSPHSHNRYLGEQLAQGRQIDAIEQEMGVLPEGYNALHEVLYRAEKLDLRAPVAGGIWAMVQGKQTPAAFVRVLLHGANGTSV